MAMQVNKLHEMATGRGLRGRLFSTSIIAQGDLSPGDLLGIVVQPLDLLLVIVGSIPTGPTHGEGRLQPHPGDLLKSTPNDRKSPRSGLNLEGRLSDPQIF